MMKLGRMSKTPRSPHRPRDAHIFSIYYKDLRKYRSSSPSLSRGSTSSRRLRLCSKDSGVGPNWMAGTSPAMTTSFLFNSLRDTNWGGEGRGEAGNAPPPATRADLVTTKDTKDTKFKTRRSRSKPLGNRAVTSPLLRSLGVLRVFRGSLRLRRADKASGVERSPPYPAPLRPHRAEREFQTRGR
jgi:hypothetical protein